MPNLLFGLVGNTEIPLDEKVVRSTATPVVDDAPAAMQEAPPDFNDTQDHDPNPNLGIVNRQLASHWVEGEQYSPFWQAAVDQQYEHNAIIDRQVSTSGTAAAREAAGQFGHGTAKYAVGIEPVGDLRDGGKMGNEYFSAGKPDIQEPAGNFMTVAPGYDQGVTGKVNQSGKTITRNAYSVYNAWWNEGK